jgi:class 3 adenylate cyclase
MQCPACRHENPGQAKFCLECGTRLVVTCANCRTELPPSAKFCLECGERVTPSGAAMLPPSASPEAYTPKHLAERILTAKAALEGERKQVTVLFADLKGSMELLADRDPEEAREILDPVLAHMMDAVHRYEGTVNQVMGDGIMALFGAPIAHEDGCLDLAYVKSVRGELSQAAGLVERAVAQCREWHITSHTPIAMALGRGYAWSGRIEEGVSCLQQALTAYESAGIGYYHSLSVEQLGEAYLLADQVENARACADRAVTLARGRGERGNEAWALRLLGDVASHRGSPDVGTASTHYVAAMSLASELAMRPLVAHCHFGLGRLYGRTGDPEQAQEHLTTATAMYGEMGMTYRTRW